MASRSTGPRLGASSEKLDQCPYDACHWIRASKLGDHLAKCRLNHQEGLAEKGELPVVLNCQYNYLHKVVNIEWKYHAAGCPDRKKLWSYQLRAGDLKEMFPKVLTISGEDIPPEEGERLEMYAGLEEGTIYCPQRKRQIKLTDIGKDGNQFAQEKAEEKGRALAEEVENEWKKEGKEKKNVVPASPPVPQPPPPPPTFQVKYTQEEIDYWNAPGTSKVPYSWLAQNSNPHGYVPNYPPGLTKKQRREFDVRNSVQLEKKMVEWKKAEVEKAAKEAKKAGQDLKEDAGATVPEVEETFTEKGKEGRTYF